MFVTFFQELKQAGVPVTLREYLTLMQAMDADLASRKVEDFYFLSRATLVKDERNLDKFDRVFGHVFKGLETLDEAVEADIPADWLKKLAEKYLTEEEKKQIEAMGGLDKLLETLRKRLAEQKRRHQGGSKWIGTAGTSPYGAYGYNPEGVRIGQDANRNFRAVKVWDKREFKDLDRRRGDTDHARATVPAGGVSRRRLAPAVACRPDPVVQGPSRPRGEPRWPAGCRGGAGRSDAAGRHDPGDPRRVRHSHGGAPACEADDVLGTLAARERRDPVVVVSGDRDLLQLVCDDPVEVRVLYLGRGLAKATKFGPAEVAETYGVPVDRAGPAYAELALLRGDPSDGLPGVPGVGEKTAATLLAQHGSLEGILAAAHDPKSKMSKAYRTKLLAATDYIEAAGPVVRVATDADVNFSTASDTLPLAAEHPRKVVKLAEQYGVTSSIGRLQKALDGLPG